MKKISVLVGSVAIALTLSACSDATANISKGSEAIVSVDGTSVTRQNIYDMLKPNNAGSATLESLKQEIYKKEGIELTDDMKKTADEKLNDLKKQFGDNYASAIQSYGFADDDAVMNNSILPALLQTELQKKYVTDNADKLFDSYRPMKAQILQADDETKAKNALTALEGDANFEETAKSYGVTTTYDGKEAVYSSGSGLPDVVFSAMTSESKAGLIDKVITDSTNSKYYIVKLVNVTPSEFKEEAIDAIASASAITNTVMQHYFEKYKMTLYDIDAYRAIKQSNPDFLVQDK